MLITVDNSLASLPTTLSTYLSSAIVSGGTILPIQNPGGFNANWGVQLGRTGEERAEILLASGISGTAFTTSGTALYPHPQDTPVYQVHYDQIVVLRSTAGTAGTASAYATTPITPDSLITEYNDTTGINGYAYRVQYYNSLNGDISGTSGWIVPGGPTWYSKQKLVSRTKAALYKADFIKSDDDVTDWINEWIELETNKALKVNEAYSLGTASYSFGTAGLGTVTEPLFKYANKVEVTTDGITYRNSTKTELNQYESTDTFNPLTPQHAWTGDTTFQVLPFGNSGTARFTLGKLSTQLVDDDDELPQFLRGYTTGCIEYVLYRANDLDSKATDADRHYNKHLKTESDFVKEITPRDFSGPQFIQFSEDLTGDDSNVFF